ncbi:kinase-like domain-containing protein [Rhizophagus irregularis DAOM 181602=DAOM 197198]|uniref:Tpk2p n=3 Tax=Rhizophagus irregularis TaxID=588596 RepID=A0A015K4R5_RHIIW|nr:Tpk2p [Rhizophagus irregularis DAOM 197198w]GBC39500.1 kinase-like domain-containing protein [Rhizophagus irregularis DAOM 181602=DAOM 197198]
MEQSSDYEQNYGRCMKCKQTSISLVCQTCDSNLKEKYGMCKKCEQIKSINMGWCYACIYNYREKKYGKCIECKQANTGQDWCQTCNSKRFQQNFNNWTSGNDDLDKFIQTNQLSAKNEQQLLEWIPYDRFHAVKYIAEGGFGKVYEASWKDALKVLNNSKNLTLEFINEITLHIKIIEDKKLDQVVRCHGISQEPSTKNYIMVMKYAKKGNLRKYLNERRSHNNGLLNFHKLNKRFLKLNYIAIGLKRIHEKGLIHRDLHTGNIVCFDEKISITDMGLCKPVNYKELENMENKVYGVLPYLAPEIMRGQKYTQASDIYSFGIIMYEVISELTPYYDTAHDECLALSICEGLRPRFNIKVPKLILDLIKRCLDADPSNRPNALDLSRIISKWSYEIHSYLKSKENQKELIQTELTKQIEEIIKNNRLSAIKNLKNKPHPGAIYTSRLLNFNNLPKPKNPDDYYSNYDDISSMQYPVYSDYQNSHNTAECLDCEIVD